MLGTAMASSPMAEPLIDRLCEKCQIVKIFHSIEKMTTYELGSPSGTLTSVLASGDVITNINSDSSDMFE